MKPLLTGLSSVATRSMQHTRTDRSCHLQLESLESREVPASVAMNGSVLEIKGDSWDNGVDIIETSTTITVHMESVPSTGFVLTPNIIDKTFNKSAVSQIMFWGYDGSDVVDSFAHSKILTAWGGNGNDSLYGSNGSDNLYGGNDNDILRGYGGNDGLYGGAGTDSLYGGTGSDRFLIMEGQTEAKDPVTEDAIIAFRNGTKTWNASEIEAIDGGLWRLHQRTGNDNLLETSAGGRMTFIRNSTSGSALAFNSNNGTITFLDGAFSSSSLAAITTIHEVGHNWDTERGAGFETWKGLSGWTTTNAPGKSRGLSSTETWYYNTSAPFALNYGKTNPREDWATAWERYFTLYYNLTDTQNLQPIGTAKYDHLDSFFNSLR